MQLGLAAQKRGWRTMLKRGPVCVDDADLRAGFERGREIVEKREGLGDFMVHMDQDRAVQRVRRQLDAAALPM